MAQVRLTLEQAESRTGPDYLPVYQGKDVAVRGQVSAKPLWAVDSFYLPIQDEAGYGLILEGNTSQFTGFEPGDWLEASGVLNARAGMPVLAPASIRVSGRGPVPAAKPLRADAVNSFRYIGVYVTVQSRLSAYIEGGGGDSITLGDRPKQLSVFRPKLRSTSIAGIEGLRSGDVVRVTGIAIQYCKLPPYDRSFQLLLPNSGGLTLVDKAWFVPPSMLLVALIAVAGVLALWSKRERHISRQRRKLRVLDAVGEEAIYAASPNEIVRKLTLAGAKTLGITGAGVFVCNRQTQTLETFYGEGSASEYAGMRPLAEPVFEAASTAFRNRTMLLAPDSRRCPFFNGVTGTPPRSAAFVPMFAQSDLVGILEVERADRVHYFDEEQQGALQHLANQIASALKLQDQHAIREQLFRTDKLAAAGQLISGIANELRGPLDVILASAEALRKAPASEPVVASLVDEARRATGIVHRLLVLSETEHLESELIDLNEILREVADLQDPALRSKNIAVRRRLSGDPLMIQGNREQLAQVILNLLIYAEQCLAESRTPSDLKITSALLARRALIEISWPARLSDAERDRGVADLVEKTGLSLEVCEAVIHSHGGEMRVSHSGSDVRFELDLPLIETKPRSATLEHQDHPVAKRQLTVLVVEPEAASQRHVVGILSAAGHRVVPVSSAEEGADLTNRLRFDLAICALRLPGLSWADFLDRVRSQVGGVVLLTDAYDPKLARTFQASDVFVLTKPADPSDLKHICETVAECGDTSAVPR